MNEQEWVIEEGINRGKFKHELGDEARTKPWLKKESTANKALAKIKLVVPLLNKMNSYVNFR